MKKLCLLKNDAERLRQDLKEGNVKLGSLLNMSTEARTKLLSKYTKSAEEAKMFNTLYESKLLLKNKTRGVINLMSKLGKIGRYESGKAAQLEQLAQEFKDQQLNETLNPGAEEAFLNDAADVMLGRHITREQATEIFKIDRQIRKYKQSYNEETSEWSSEADKSKYGSTKRALENYISDIGEDVTVKSMLVSRGYKFQDDWQIGKGYATSQMVLSTAKTIAENSVSLVASVDNSFVGRQGIGVLLTGHPVIWGNAAVRSVGDIIKTFKGTQTTDALLADLYSDPLFLNGEYQKAGLVDTREEQFPTSLPERIADIRIKSDRKIFKLLNAPTYIAGTAFKASEAAFINSGLRMRTDLYKLIRKQQTQIPGSDAEVVLEDDVIKGIGQVINSLTARGSLGKFENPLIRLLMWAPKMLKGSFDVLTAHKFTDIPRPVRKVASRNLLKMLMTTLIIQSIVQLVNDDSAEWNPLSTDFLAIKGGDTRVNYNYYAKLITLTARLITGKYKSSTTGEIKSYKDVGSSRLEALQGFFENKAPPATGAVYDILEGEDFDGNEPTLSSILYQRNTPITIQNVVDLTRYSTIDRILGTFLDFWGVSSQSYSDSNKKSKNIPENEIYKEGDFLSAVKVYARAMNDNPEDAWNKIFTGQRIVQVSGIKGGGGIVVTDRSKSSADIKKEFVKKYGSNVEFKEIRLDHTIPVKLGGDDVEKKFEKALENPNMTDEQFYKLLEDSNLRVVSKSVWSSYTKVEINLIKYVKEGKLSQKEARELILDFKSITNTAKRKKKGEDIIAKYK